MKRKSKKENQLKNISERVMVATLASSMILTPSLRANAATYEISSDSVENAIGVQTTDNMQLAKEAEDTQAIQSKVSILESNGWLESASVEWKPVQGATGYNVYYKSAKNTDSTYKQLDTELIRKYKSYFRADALGLSAGDYVLKIVPVLDDKEEVSEEAVTKNIKVLANTREGFAFSSSSPMGTGSGGYNDDGTLANDAQILYITADNVNTITADVITNNKGKTTTCTGLIDILAKRQKAYDKRPLVIRMIGQVDASDINGLNGSGYVQLKGCYNVTFEGVGEDATAYKWGFLVRDAHNVEIRNIGVMLFPDDGISLDTGNENIWVHNNDIFYGTAGSDKDQAKGDGSCDVKGKSDYVTVAYNHFYDSGKCSLCGMSDTEDFHVSYHHNWFDHSDSRHPRIRVGTVHIYNNYFDGNAKYGVGITKGGSALVEANYFRNCKYPMLISRQGTDIYSNSKGTFSGEAGGMIKAYNNKIEGEGRLVYANEDAVEFDAYLAQSRNEQVPSSYSSVSGGNTYNNFDTSSSMYSYNPDSPEDVKENVTTYAGRVNGGDFGWNFTEADDTSYTLNAELMDKIKAYKTDLVFVGGNSVSDVVEDKPVVEEKPVVDEKPNVEDKPVVDEKPDVEDKPVVDDNNQGVSDKNDSNDSDNANDGDVSVGNISSTGMYTNLVNSEDKEFTGAVYASNDGNAENDGTYEAPLDLKSAFEKVESGEASGILLESGTYKLDKQITISASGTKNAYNVLKACKGESVTLDFSAQPYSKETAKNQRGIQLNGSYWYVSGITIKGAADNGMMLSGSNNIIERCIFDKNRDTGLQISRKSSSVKEFKDWPSNNFIINCTSKNNCDPATYENADGFAAKLTCGNGNVFDGCISYNNSDDGWDLFAKTATGSTGVVTIRNCIAMRNGMTEDGTTNSNCDGNGFKLGGSGVPTPHVVTNCLAIENLHHGFTDNNNPSALKITNCTAFDNNKGGKKNNFSLYRCKDAVVSNCISYTTNGTSDKFVNLTADHAVFTNSNKWYKVTNSQAVNTGSSTQRGEVISNGTTSSDFINSKIPSVGTDFDKLWRNEDGTINTNGAALISESSAFAAFSSDGGIIGARFSKNNEIDKLEVKIDTTNTPVINKPDTTEPEDKPDTDNKPEIPDTEDKPETPDTEEKPSEDITETPSEGEAVQHNFTTDDKNNEFFEIAGSLSTIKGLVEYDGLTLSQCLKIDSKASIKFTTTNSSKLTLVFNSDFNKSIKIDGIKYKAIDGIVSVDLEKGSHEIIKGDVANLYYIRLS